MTARVIVIGNQKGGVGKTTLSVGLACAWAELGRRVMLLDCDPQKSASMWLGDEPQVDVAAHDGANLSHAVRVLGGSYDAIVADLPPGLPDVIEASLEVADDLLIPLQPSGLDIAAAQTMLELARCRAGLRARFVINRLARATSIGRNMRTAIEPLGLPVCRQDLATRVAHMEAVIARQPVTAYQPGSAAAAEMRALAQEVWSDG